MHGKLGTPPPGNNVLVLAKEYGRPPEEVEKWEPYWFKRALLKLEGESIHAARERSRINNSRRRR